MRRFNIRLPMKLGASGGCSMSLIDLLLADKFVGGQAANPNIEPLTITENGTYTAPDGVDGYSPVTVDVKGSGEELVLTDFSYFHYNNVRLECLDRFDTSKCTSFANAFYNCKELTTVSKLDTSNGTDFKNMFFQCLKLTSIPNLDTSNGTDLSGMFQGCESLKTVSELDTSNCTNFKNMFYYCTSLISIPKLDLDRAGSNATSGMLDYCKALTDLYLYNIGRPIKIGSGTSWGHLLTVDSLVHTFRQLARMASKTTLTIGTANLEKISNIYCRVTDYQNYYITMELCESTDDGAMTLEEYAAEKNWSIA